MASRRLESKQTAKVAAPPAVAPPPPPVPPVPPVAPPAVDPPLPEGASGDTSNPFSTWSTDALVAAVKALASVKEFNTDKGAQASMEQMAEELKGRPVPVEEPEVPGPPPPVRTASVLVAKEAKWFPITEDLGLVEFDQLDPRDKRASNDLALAKKVHDALKLTSGDVFIRRQAGANYIDVHTDITRERPQFQRLFTIKTAADGTKAYYSPADIQPLIKGLLPKQGSMAITNQDTSKITEGGGRVPELAQAHGLTSDKTGIEKPATVLPGKFAVDMAQNEDTAKITEGGSRVPEFGEAASEEDDNTGVTKPSADVPGKFAGGFPIGHDHTVGCVGCSSEYLKENGGHWTVDDLVPLPDGEGFVCPYCYEESGITEADYVDAKPPAQHPNRPATDDRMIEVDSLLNPDKTAASGSWGGGAEEGSAEFIPKDNSPQETKRVDDNLRTEHQEGKHVGGNSACPLCPKKANRTEERPKTAGLEEQRGVQWSFAKDGQGQPLVEVGGEHISQAEARELAQAILDLLGSAPEETNYDNSHPDMAGLKGAHGADGPGWRPSPVSEAARDKQRFNASVEVPTGKATKQAETLVDKLKSLYLEAKTITKANDSRPVREAVESIFRAMEMMAEAQKVLDKQKRQEELEEEAQKITEEKAGKKASSLGLKLVGSLDEKQAAEDCSWLKEYPNLQEATLNGYTIGGDQEAGYSLDDQDGAVSPVFATLAELESWLVRNL